MTSDKFNEDWDFQQRMQQMHALELYRERFPRCDIVEVDTEGERERVAQIFDFAGVDKMIRKESGVTVLLSQRFRRKSVGDDFSLTYSRPHSQNPVEFERLRLAKNDPHAMMPQLYGFGIADDIKNGQSADKYAYEQGFHSFYILQVPKVVDAIEQERIDFFVPRQTSNGRGNRAAYIDPFELDNVGAVERAWTFDDSDGQANLGEFGADDD